MMNIDYTDKISIVTGGDRGIGREIAEKLLALNCEVIITSPNKCPIWCTEYKNCIYKHLDFLDEWSVEIFFSEINDFKTIDVLVNNAGIQIKNSIDRFNIVDWNNVLNVNLDGPMKIIREVIPLMKKDGGKILNISSVAGIISKPGQSAYSASKSGLIGLTRSSALDLARYNILVNALCPGTTSTDMVEEILTKEQKESIMMNIPMKRFATVREIANFAIFLCSEYNTYITGQTIIVDGGFTNV